MTCSVMSLLMRPQCNVIFLNYSRILASVGFIVFFQPIIFGVLVVCFYLKILGRGLEGKEVKLSYVLAETESPHDSDESLGLHDWSFLIL